MNNIISSTTQIKANNKKLVKLALMELKQGTKNKIAEKTGLSIAACNTLLNELAEKGEIIELTPSSKLPGPGRPSKSYILNYAEHLGCCLSLHNEQGNKYLRYSVIDLSGNILERNCYFEPLIDYTCIKALLSILYEKYNKLKTISIGIPGTVDKHSVIEKCSIEELTGINLQYLIGQDFPLSVAVERDMNLIAYGLYKDQPSSGVYSVAAVSWSGDTCPGAGIVMNGSIIKGKSNFAGELSHLPLSHSLSKRLRFPMSRKDTESSGNEMICKTIETLVCTLNPDVILLDGEGIHINMMDSILEQCKKLIPEQHMPALTFAQDTYSYYLDGLSEKVIQHLC